MPLLPGQVLNNRYRIVKLLGQGGFGAVYRAWDINIKGPCAVKENFDTSPSAQAQFEREASLLFNLRHPNLPKVFDSFTIPGQGQYLVMEYIEGEDLEQMLERTGAPLDEAQVLVWIVQVCDALSYLHKQSPPIIHRDLKPANIRITSRGQAMLVDFGIAKLYDPNLRTTLGARAVTPGYSPNEQYLSLGRTDPRTDIYALGATMYTVFTHQVPSEAPERNMGMAMPSIRALNPSISPQVEEAILKAMEILPDRRFQSAVEFQKAIGGQHSRETVQPLRRGGVDGSTVPPPPARRLALPRLLWGLGGVVAMVALVTVIGLLFSRDKTEHSVTPTALVLVVTETRQQVTEQVPTDTSTPIPSLTPTPTQTPTQMPTDTPEPSPTGLAARITDAKGIEMALIPASEFRMGSSNEEITLLAKEFSAGTEYMFYYLGDEQPQHPVYLDDFYIDIYEVTNALYTVCVKARVCTSPQNSISSTRNSYYGNPEYGNYPVVYVNWTQAEAYCKWRESRLPTAAEWEKAARGTEGHIYPWGNDFVTCNRANFVGCVDDTQAVGSYPEGASPYGVFDMVGNVWEWVLDGYSFYSSALERNPIGPISGEYHLIRGGSWFSGPMLVHPAFRYQRTLTVTNNFLGFRCARSSMPE